MGCSMGCNIGNRHGYQYRERSVTKEAIGLGRCWDEDSPDRREQKDCNDGKMMRCKGDEKCVAQQDLIIALDASGSLREEGYLVLRDFAVNLTKKMETSWGSGEAMRVGAVGF